MDMEFHNGMSSSGKLYGFGLLLAECLTAAADELPAARVVVSFTRVAEHDESRVAELEVAEELDVARVADELLTASVICGTLDEDVITHIVTSEELDSGIYRSIW